MSAISARLPDATVERLRSCARAEDRTVSDVISRAVEEYLRATQFPGIVFVQSGSGRRKAKLLAGPAVWAVVWTVREHGGDHGRAAEHLGIGEADVRLGLAYHDAFPDDTEERIRRMVEADGHPQRLHPAVTVLTVA